MMEGELETDSGQQKGEKTEVISCSAILPKILVFGAAFPR